MVQAQAIGRRSAPWSGGPQFRLTRPLVRPGSLHRLSVGEASVCAFSVGALHLGAASIPAAGKIKDAT